MEELSRVLTHPALAALRAAYDPQALLGSKVDATTDAHTPLARWTAVIGDTFYRSSPLSPRERELCLIALLSARDPGLSLATHVYAGLMEGLSVDEIVHAAALAGCYSGLPAYTSAAATMHKTLGILQQLADRQTVAPKQVLAALVKALTGISL